MVIPDRQLNILKHSANKQAKETHRAMDRTVTTLYMILFYLYIQIKKYIWIVCRPLSMQSSLHFVTLGGSQ